MRASLVQCDGGAAECGVTTSALRLRVARLRRGCVQGAARRTAAAEQFAANGYNETSYTSIAEQCGISRNLVQYYWPRKELLALDYMGCVLADSMASLGYSDGDIEGDFKRIAQVGAAFFDTLLAKPGTSRFLFDIISDRALTEAVLAFNFDWVMAHVGAAPQPNADAAQRAVIKQMGGFYDLLYWCLKNSRPFDVRSEIAPVVEAFAAALATTGDDA